MGFIEAVKTCLIEKPVTMQGRAPRSEYWWYFLFQMILVGGMSAYNYAAMTAGPEAAALQGGPLSLAILAVGTVLIIPAWSVSVRRMHDRGRSGLWIAPLFLYNIVTSLMQIYIQTTGDFSLMLDGAVVLGIGGMIFGLGALVMIVYFMFRGTPGPNAYGPDPLGAQADAEIFA
ncbi:DUF805 domain-containing protein [Rhodovulum sp. DZ06]|uniref:DUF805 domain-containing protein n=1 Tax=Rhodovulum sp. DZ06 TaxID=3425126 RepID=UPI003D34A00C